MRTVITSGGLRRASTVVFRVKTRKDHGFLFVRVARTKRELPDNNDDSFGLRTPRVTILMVRRKYWIKERAELMVL